MSQLQYLEEWTKIYIKLKRKQFHLYRDLDSNRNILDIRLQKHRDTRQAYISIKRLIRCFGESRALITDICTAKIKVVSKFKNNRFLKSVDYHLSKYLTIGSKYLTIYIKKAKNNVALRLSYMR
ncbi:MAG: DDE-type integrase/transposase/recombinase [Carnobacterium maltaromaticum]